MKYTIIEGTVLGYPIMADEEDSVYCENRQGKGNKDPVKAWVFAPNSKYDKYWENRHHIARCCR